MRAEIATKFNDSTNPSQILISTFDLISTGLNLHHSANVLVIFDKPKNTNIKNEHTIDGYLEYNNYFKYADYLRTLPTAHFTKEIEETRMQIEVEVIKRHPNDARKVNEELKEVEALSVVQGRELGIARLFARRFRH
ncbi:hypothetical protein H2201_000001 [Coniosporium apollinis]|uniref:Helicase C-terminal domain-containing protein n=1 Tax=Coniosporium apollinis TaxID=61459 RepID=A0ABQ9P6B1_9PEZI|nr:hypothetical protein H2201_000001 [Coniosporium apollinis]